jgi:hypothetical protein
MGGGGGLGKGVSRFNFRMGFRGTVDGLSGFFERDFFFLKGFSSNQTK